MKRPRISLSTRIFLGFVLMLLAFSASSIFAVSALRSAKKDLVVLTRGYLALGRTATTLRTLQEVHDQNIARAVAEPDRLRRAELSGFARELYPEAIGESLAELQTLARQLQSARVSPSDAVFLENVFAQARRARTLAVAYDEATGLLLDVLDDVDGVDAKVAIEAWRKRSEQASRDLRTLALGVDSRAADALVRIERAEAQSLRAIVVAFVTAVVIAVVILIMMLRALRPLRSLTTATRAMRAGGGIDAVSSALDEDAAVKDDAEVAVLAEELVSLARSLDERGAALAKRSDELARLSAFAENVIRTVRVGIVVVDDNDVVRTINPAARSVFSLPLRELEGQGLQALQGAFEAALPALSDVRKHGELSGPQALTLGDKVVEVTVVPMRDRAGARSGEVLILGEDVTAREDARSRLVHSERLAAIGRLAAQITHEIRNPLSSIGLNIELLADDVPLLPADRRDEVQSILDAVLQEVRRLAEITEGYLRFSRLPTAQRQSRDLGDVVADLVAFMAEEAEHLGVNIELHVPKDGGLPAVDIDADRLRQALLNLVKNAVDAVGRGGTVKVSVFADDADHVAVDVADNGPGVDVDVREQIFSPFFTSKKEGTGLGLVVAREIAREHGGDVSVGDSDLGGAAFRLRLPVKRP
jgi:nitrogen fixation/metabolism regulation signal transduction histidine kinase